MHIMRYISLLTYLLTILHSTAAIPKSKIPSMWMWNNTQMYTSTWVALKSKPQSFVHIFAKYWPIFKIFHWCILWKKCVVNWLLNIPTHLNCVATLAYLVKYKICKIHQLVKIWTRVWSLIFWPILKVKLRFVLDRLSVFVNLRRRYCRTGWAKN